MSCSLATKLIAIKLPKKMTHRHFKEKLRKLIFKFATAKKLNPLIGFTRGTFVGVLYLLCKNKKMNKFWDIVITV